MKRVRHLSTNRNANTVPLNPLRPPQLHVVAVLPNSSAYRVVAIHVRNESSQRTWSHRSNGLLPRNISSKSERTPNRHRFAPEKGAQTPFAPPPARPSSALQAAQHASGDSSGAAAAHSSALQLKLTDFGGSISRAEALTVFFASVVSTVAVVADMSRAGATDDGLGVVDDLLADCPSVRNRRSVYPRR